MFENNEITDSPLLGRVPVPIRREGKGGVIFSHIELQSLLTPFLESEFILQTRINELQSKIYKNGKLFIKREDELSSGIAGSKFRKYASLIPFLKKENFDEVIVIGGMNSNNIVAAMQLLREFSIKAKFLIHQSYVAAPIGNELWTRMLLHKKIIEYISSEEWKNVNSIADEYLSGKAREGKKIFILREGGSVLEAIPGAMTLALDILRNEEMNGITFKNIFVDSGTGTTAMGLIIAMEYLGMNDREVHITLIAGTQEEFEKNLQYFRERISELLKTEKCTLAIKVHFHKPSVSAGFGKVNEAIIQKTISIAKQEGILMEPVYSVKHFMVMEDVLDKGGMEGDALFIYNGGALGLTGFTDKLKL